MRTINEAIKQEYEERKRLNTLDEIPTELSFQGHEERDNRYPDPIFTKIYHYKLNEYSNNLNKQIDDMVKKNKFMEPLNELLFRFPSTSKFNPKQFIETNGGTPMKVIKSLKEALDLDWKHIYLSTIFDHCLNPLSGSNNNPLDPLKGGGNFYASIVHPTMRKIN